MHLGDRILRQEEMTLNLLQQSTIAPKVSAWTYLCGPHDFNKMPFAPLGVLCKVMMSQVDQNHGTPIHPMDCTTAHWMNITGDFECIGKRQDQK